MPLSFESTQDSAKFPEGVTPLIDVGITLQNARLEKNICSKSLAESLKIGEEQLLALEKGNEKELPELVFIKALIRRVAEKLELDSDPLINLLKKSSFDISTQRESKKNFLKFNSILKKFFHSSS